jgi:hypothetical protein
MTVTRLHERFGRIERAYHAALDGRDPESVLAGACEKCWECWAAARRGLRRAMYSTAVWR